MRRIYFFLSPIILLLFLGTVPPKLMGQCAPPLLTADPNSTLCAGSPSVLTASMPLPSGCNLAPGSPYNWSGPGVSFSTTTSSLPLNTPAAGTFTVSVTVVDDGSGTCPCTGGVPFATATIGPSNGIAINPLPSAPFVPFQGAICEGETATITATPVGGVTGTFEWFSDPGATNQIYSGNPLVTSPLFFSASFFVRVVSAAGCPGPVTSVFQGVSANPADPIGTGATICPGTDATLTATSPGGGILSWWDSPVSGTQLGTGGSFNTGTLFQTTIFYVQVTAPNGCVSERTAVTATVLPPIANPVAPDIFICAGELGEIVATGTGTAGNTFLWYDVPVGGTPIQTAPMPTSPAAPNDTLIVGPFLPGSAIFYVSEFDLATGCESQRTAVTVFVNQQVPEPQADDEEICQGDSVTLVAQYGVGSSQGDFYWWTDSLGGSLLQIGQNYTPPSSLIGNPGTYDFWVEEQLNGCASPTRDRVTITVFPSPAAPFGITDTVCAGGNAALQAVTLTPGNIIEWYTDGAAQNIISFGPFFSTPALTQNTTYFLRERNPTTGCTGPIVPITAIVVNNPIAPGASDLTVCENETPTLTVTSSGDAFAQLNLYGPGGTFLQSGPVGALTVNFSLGSLGQGVYTYYVEEEETVSGCVGPQTAVTVTVNEVPANPVANGTTICPGSNASLTATSGGGTNGTFNWYADAGLTNLLSTGSVFTTPALTATTTYYVSETNNDCEGLATPVTVTVSAPLLAPTATGATICAGATATLTAQASQTGTVLNWYDDAAGTNGIATGASFTTPALNQNTTYYVREIGVGNGCESPLTAVTATVAPNPVAPTAADLNICAADQAVIVVAATGNANTRVDLYNVASGGTALQQGGLAQSSLSFNVGLLAQGVYVYYVEEVNTVTGCVSSRTAVTVTVSAAPANPAVSGTLTICEGDNTTLTATGTSGTFTWYADAALSNQLSIGSSYTTPGLSSTTSYWVTETIGGCESTPTQVTVTVNPSLADPTVTGATVCTGTPATLTASGSGNLNWYADATGTTLLFTGSSYTTPPLTQATTYWVQAQNAGTGCVSALVSVVATVIPNPTAPTANDPTFCAGEAVVITASGSGATNSRLDLYNAPTGGTALQSGTLGNGTETFNLGPFFPSVSVFYVEEVNTTTGCVSSRTAVTVTVNAIPAAPTAPGATICAGASATLSATGAGTINWYADAGLTNLLGTGSSYVTAPLSATTNYYVTSTVNGCESPATQVVVTVDPLPADPTVTGATVCEGETATLSASGTPGNQLNWYDNAAGNTVIFTGVSFTTPPLTQNTTYWVQEVGVGSGCVSNLVPVVATVNPLPPTPSTADVSFCADEAIVIGATGTGNANTRLDLYAQATGGTIVSSARLARARRASIWAYSR
jgi:hypothetical protein